MRPVGELRVETGHRQSITSQLPLALPYPRGFLVTVARRLTGVGFRRFRLPSIVMRRKGFDVRTLLKESEPWHSGQHDIPAGREPGSVGWEPAQSGGAHPVRRSASAAAAVSASIRTPNSS